MGDDIKNFFISLITSFFGVVLALYLERRKMPEIELSVIDSAHADNDYRNSNPPIGNPQIGRCKFFRIVVTNKKMPKYLGWLIRRNTAENCRAQIVITGIDNTTNFSLDGRWTDTPELPFLRPEDYFQKIINPDPVTIVSGSFEKLDLLARYDNENCAYIWNNKSYLNNWRTLDYKLIEGSYSAKITINTQNGISATKEFKIFIGHTIEDTFISYC